LRDELDKLLLAPAPERGLDALDRLGLLASVLPELVPLRDCVAGEGRPSVFRHTLDAIARSARPGRLPGRSVLRDAGATRVLRWTLLLHDLAKPETLSRREDGRPAFHGHETLGARRADALMRRLALPRAFRRRVAQLVRLHLRPHHLADSGPTPRGLRRLVRDAGEDLPVLVLHAACDAVASGSPDARARWRRLRPVLAGLLALRERSLAEPLPTLVNGTDVMLALGIGPGPDVGRLLREIRELQEDGTIDGREAALEYLASAGGRGPSVSGRRRPRASGGPRTSPA
jgi:tRNA nucleotidyltransferase/poly(A) polymerase